jgi:hypothetical protein
VAIWKDFEKKELNQAAAEWLTWNGAEGNEPWVFLIGRDGRIVARWDNVATRDEIDRSWPSCRHPTRGSTGRTCRPGCRCLFETRQAPTTCSRYPTA